MAKTAAEKAAEKKAKEEAAAAAEADRRAALTDEERAAEDAALTAAAGASTKSKRDSVTVAWRNGTRTYSRAVHGDDFEALAKEFCDKHNAKVVA